MLNTKTPCAGLVAQLINFLFPPRCILCHTLLDQSDPAPLCPACLARYTPGQRVLRPRGGTFFRDCVAVMPYSGCVRKAVHRYKFYGKAYYAKTFGLWLAACIRAGYPDTPVTVTWVPVSAKRLRKRGYDQARLLAEQAADALGLPCVQLLHKKADTPPQSGLKDPARRRANVADVYRAVPGAPIDGRHILLVDDVFTTGATLSECARTLLMAGADTVNCAVLAAKM